MVKALDLKSNGIFPRRFEPYSQRYFHHRFPVSCPTRTISIVSYLLSCDGRVVKAFDSKSNGIFPRRFESYSQRLLVSHWVDLENFTKTCALSGNRTPVSRVAGENSTTEPTMLDISGICWKVHDQSISDIFILLGSSFTCSCFCFFIYVCSNL